MSVVPMDCAWELNRRINVRKYDERVSRVQRFLMRKDDEFINRQNHSP